MKTTITATLTAAVVALGALAGGSLEAGAQGKPEVGRAPEALGSPSQPPAHPSLPQGQQAPSDDAPSAQDETPAPSGGCPNPGRPLQLIV